MTTVLQSLQAGLERARPATPEHRVGRDILTHTAVLKGYSRAFQHTPIVLSPARSLKPTGWCRFRNSPMRAVPRWEIMFGISLTLAADRTDQPRAKVPAGCMPIR
jgi:hypothetical protein